MRHLASLSVCLVILFSGVNADTTDFSGSFFWPLKLEKQISSGFGDGRPGRFHMGLDLRTGGREGASVYAPEDGYVWRIKTAYNGYGIGLYLRGVSGRTYVFGHLQALNKTIGSFLERKQLENRRYYQDLQPSPETLPVKRGSRVAYSGQTGAGAPHLHFEVRDAQDRPTNPLLYRNVGLRDATPPKFKAVWLVYRDGGSLFADGGREIKLKPVIGKTGRSYIPDTILVTGRFAVEAAVEDVVAPGSFMVGPERMTLTIDGSLYHQVEYDRLDYAENRLSLLDRDPDPDKSDYDRVYALYRKQGNGLSNYRADIAGDGTFADTVEGFHAIAIEAADAFGNTRRLEFTIFYTPSTEIVADLSDAHISDSLIILPLAPVAGRAAFDKIALYGLRNDRSDTLLHIRQTLTDETLSLRGKFARYSQFRLVFKQQGIPYPPVYLFKSNAPSVSAISIAPPDFKIMDDGLLCSIQTIGNRINWLTGFAITDGKTDTFTYRQVAPGRFAAFYRPAKEVEFIDRIIIVGPERFNLDSVVRELYRLKAGRPASIDYGENLTIEIEAGDLFGDALFMVRDTFLQPPESGSFVRRPFALLPAWLAFAAPIKLIVQLTTLPDTVKTAFYIHREGNRWSWVGRRVDIENDRLTATVSGGGVYAVLTDTTPPVVTGLNIEDRSSITSSRPTIRCAVSDDLSGFEDDRNFDLTIDGKWIIPVYDPERGVLTGKPHWNIFGTSHTLRLTVRDRCGNTTTVTRTFHVMARTGPKK